MFKELPWYITTTINTASSAPYNGSYSPDRAVTILHELGICTDFYSGSPAL